MKILSTSITVLAHFQTDGTYPKLTSFGKWQMKEKLNMLKVSLRDVRESRGYSVKGIANHCSLKEDCYREYENDFGKTPARIAFAICSLLKVSLDSIYMSE